MSDPFLDSTRNLARWLQEAGRRKAGPAAAVPAPPPERHRPRFTLGRELRGTRWVPLLALAALAYLEYFFADTFVQINALPALVVFVF